MAGSSKAWKCVVCGYVHRGDTPPETCPVCGAPASDFESFEETSPPSPAKSTSWRCLICGYVHDGDTSPDTCPLCGAGREEFEACVETPAPAAGATDKRKIVIIGGGIAGVSAAEAARQALPGAEILLFTTEAGLPYYRLNLTRHLAGEVGDDALIIHSRAWYEEQAICLRTGMTINALDVNSHTILTEDGETVSYDKLVLACGAHPFIPPIPGAELEGVSAIRTLEDVRQLLERVTPEAPCVCIGGGILGLETAGALAKRGIRVTLLEGFEYLLPRQLNREAAKVLEIHVKSMGIDIITNASTKVLEGDGMVCGVLLQNGTRLPARAVTITTGIRTNSHLARRAGLAVNQGIVVDMHMASSAPDIYAAGDCAEFGGAVAGLWEPAQYQGTIAGLNAAGAMSEFGGIPRANTLKVLGIKLFSMGVIQPDDGSYLEIADQEEGQYRRFLFRDGILAGAILIGDTRLAAAVTRASREHLDCSTVAIATATASDVAAFLEPVR